MCSSQNQAFRESKDRTIPLHDHDGGVKVIGMMLNFFYTGGCNVDQFSTDPADGLLLRLQLFKLADFLDMPDHELQEKNLKCFGNELGEISFGVQLSPIGSFLYDTENAPISYIQECRKLLCVAVPAKLLRDPGMTESADSGFWVIFRSDMNFASDMAFELAKSNAHLNKFDEKVFNRLTAAERCFMDKRPSSSLPAHQRPPGPTEHEYRCRRKSCRGCFTAACMNHASQIRMSCPYCEWSDHRDRWDPHDKHDSPFLASW
jgi:hypothetical protein